MVNGGALNASDRKHGGGGRRKEKVAFIIPDQLTKIPLIKGTFKIETRREAQEKPGLTLRERRD